MAFGEWLKDARGEMSQDTLAERADVSRGYITSIESNKRTPSIGNVIALAKGVYKHPLEGLAALAGDEYIAEVRSLLSATGKYQVGSSSEIIILDPDELELIRFFRALTEEKRRWFKEATKILKGGRGGAGLPSLAGEAHKGELRLPPIDKMPSKNFGGKKSSKKRGIL